MPRNNQRTDVSRQELQRLEARLTSLAGRTARQASDSDELPVDAVDTVNIANDAVTEDKIADGAVTFKKLASGGTTSGGGGNYSSQAETRRSGATDTVEVYYTARPDGDGYAESEVTTSTPAGFVIERKLYFSDKFNADPDTAADWTLYTTQPADNTAFATAKASLLAGLNDTDGTANTRGTLPVSLKMTHRFAQDLLLEDFPGAAAAYSLRKISSDYTGSAIRIREGGTNTETDIGFDSNGDLDTAAIATHCGSNNGFVVTWYDQSGNSRDATAAADTNEPKIYDGTTGVHTTNGKPALQFDGTDDGLDLPNAVQPANINNCSAFTVQAPNNGGALELSATSVKWIQPFGWFIPTEYFGYGSANGAIGGYTVTQDKQRIITAIAGSIQGDCQVFSDGVSQGSTPLVSATPVAGQGRIGGSSTNSLEGYAQEVIVYHSDQSANRTGIEADISAYWTDNKRTLDAYPGASAAYSVRKLDNDYTGSALRVREDSGNTETDIGFDSNGDLDTAAIASHCGSANGYVVTWYDQSGSGNDVTQSTTTKQPQIYNGTAVITRNGKPAVHFFPVGSLGTGLDGVTLSVSNRSRTIFAVQSLETTGPSGGAQVIGRALSSTYAYWSVISGARFVTQAHRTSGRIDAFTAVAEPVGTQILKVDVANTSNLLIYKNGTQVDSRTDNNADWSSTAWGLGGLPSMGNNASGNTLAEVVMYESDQLTNRTGIEGDINTYYQTQTQLLLDTYGGAAAAYSVRKLSQWYTGSCMRIREDSGDTEADIGFDSNGDLDTAAIASHCGSANGYVVTWYDQSGNNIDATQSTTADQPKIYDGATTATLLENGKPAPLFSGSQYLESSSTLTATLNSETILTVCAANSTSFEMTAVVRYQGSGARRIYQPHYRTNPDIVLSWSATANYTYQSSLDTDQHLFTAYGGSSTSYAYMDGSGGTMTTQSGSNTSVVTIGAFQGGAAFDWRGTIQEHVVWHSDQHANRTGIEGNVNTYFSIYP